MIVHSGVQAALAFLYQGMRGHRDDREILQPRIAAQDLRSSKSVHFGHLQVHEDHIERWRLIALGENFDSFTSMIGNRYDRSDTLE